MEIRDIAKRNGSMVPFSVNAFTLNLQLTGFSWKEFAGM